MRLEEVIVEGEEGALAGGRSLRWRMGEGEKEEKGGGGAEDRGGAGGRGKGGGGAEDRGGAGGREVEVAGDGGGVLGGGGDG